MVNNHFVIYKRRKIQIVKYKTRVNMQKLFKSSQLMEVYSINIYIPVGNSPGSYQGGFQSTL